MTLTTAALDLCCPSCGSDALYKYGHSREGKQRYICLVCNRQFIPGKTRAEVTDRPLCDVCGSPMYAYTKASNNTRRFRCSCYPRCRTYKKVSAT